MINSKAEAAKGKPGNGAKHPTFKFPEYVTEVQKLEALNKNSAEIIVSLVNTKLGRTPSLDIRIWYDDMPSGRGVILPKPAANNLLELLKLYCAGEDLNGEEYPLSSLAEHGEVF